MERRPYTILRTATGSPVAPYIIERLKALPDVKVIAVDTDPLSSGFLLADEHCLIPPVASPEFLDALLAICKQRSVDLLFPDLDEELPLIAKAKSRFEAIGCRVLISSPKVIGVCCDKYSTFKFLREHKLKTPETRLPEEVEDGTRLSFPLIIKPRKGRGSRDVFKVTNGDEFRFFVRYVRDPVIQEFVEGIEYSVDTLSDLDGQFLYLSIRQRIATDSGISIKGRTVSHDAISASVKKAVDALGLIGPACVQCIENVKGDVNFIEINPRIAGTVALSEAAGAPIVKDAVRLMRGQKPHGPENYRTGVTMLRRWQEIIIDHGSEAEPSRVGQNP